MSLKYQAEDVEDFIIVYYVSGLLLLMHKYIGILSV